MSSEKTSPLGRPRRRRSGRVTLTRRANPCSTYSQMATQNQTHPQSLEEHGEASRESVLDVWGLTIEGRNRRGGQLAHAACGEASLDIAGHFPAIPALSSSKYALDDTKRQNVPRRRRRTMASMNGRKKTQAYLLLFWDTAVMSIALSTPACGVARLADTVGTSSNYCAARWIAA